MRSFYLLSLNSKVLAIKKINILIHQYKFYGMAMLAITAIRFCHRRDYSIKYLLYYLKIRYPQFYIPEYIASTLVLVLWCAVLYGKSPMFKELDYKIFSKTSQKFVKRSFRRDQFSSIPGPATTPCQHLLKLVGYLSKLQYY